MHNYDSVRFRVVVKAHSTTTNRHSTVIRECAYVYFIVCNKRHDYYDVKSSAMTEQNNYRSICISIYIYLMVMYV